MLSSLKQHFKHMYSTFLLRSKTKAFFLLQSMAFVYSAPHSLSCARFMAMQTCSSLMPFQRQRSCYSISFHLQSPLTTKKSIYNSFSSHNNKSSSSDRSLKISCTRSHDMAVVYGDTWDECVLNSDIPVLVEFWAAWCGPCRMVHREMEEIAKEYSGKINCYMLKADENMEIADKYGIKAVPVVLLFKNGEKRDSITGTMPNYVYMAAIEKLLSS